MNIFAKICEVSQLSGSKTRYYSIHFEDKQVDEVDDFFQRHENEESLEDELNELFNWIDGIAHQTGALEIFFRHERKAVALPPDNHVRVRNRKRFHIQYQEINRLRLYLIRLNDAVVILLNGGVKTNNDPEHCPNVRRYFRQAQIVADAIDEALQTGDIRYNPDKTSLIIHSDFEIQFT